MRVRAFVVLHTIIHKNKIAPLPYKSTPPMRKRTNYALELVSVLLLQLTSPFLSPMGTGYPCEHAATPLVCPLLGQEAAANVVSDLIPLAAPTHPPPLQLLDSHP